MILIGDCVERMREMPADSIDAVVCDPPYGLEFMGKEWDRLVAAPRGARAGAHHDPTLEQRDDTPQHRSAVRQPSHLLRCARCGGNSSGEWNRCACPHPDFRSRADLGFAMQQWHETWAVEALRVLKPGGYLIAAGGTRTHHRLMAGIEDAGFEIRDCLSWMYGSGFPKSLDVSKALDRELGQQRPVAGRGPVVDRGALDYGGSTGKAKNGLRGEWETHPPSTPAAERWQGWGTALKPAWEPVVLARKPLAGTVAGNVIEHGTGALNIDAARIGSVGGVTRHTRSSGVHRDRWDGNEATGDVTLHGGRWPANVLLSHDPDCVQLESRRIASNGHYPAARGEGGLGTAGHGGQDGLDERHMAAEVVERWACVPDCPVRMLDDQSGYSRDGVSGRGRGFQRGGYVGGATPDSGLPMVGYGGSGYASRFFYCAKASRAERNAGLEGEASRELRTTGKGLGAAPRCPEHGESLPSGSNTYRCGCPTAPRKQTELEVAQRNHHPTVKPVAVMRWLCRLVCPPGGVVLDPFMGSGTTGIAAGLEGFRFVGIERDAEYAEIARRRIAYWAAHGGEALDVVRRAERGERERSVVAGAGQLDLFSVGWQDAEA